MWSRCTNKKQRSYKDYGGRGIKVCDRWRSFEAFFEDMGERPSKAHSIERRDTNGNYEPGNCVWATDEMQTRNRRSTKTVTINGVTKPLIAWCEETGVRYGAAKQRINKLGWDPARAVTESTAPGASRLPES